jgi:hypothetical protein
MKGLLVSGLLSSCAASPFVLLRSWVTDPVLLSRSERRELECQRMSEADATARFPGRVSVTPPREIAGATVDILVCSPRVVPIDDRPARQERLLVALSEQVSQVTERAVELMPEPDTRWLVEAHDPSAAVAVKLAVAAKTNLAERRRRVSDAPPTLAAGDVAVLMRMPAARAHAVACLRYHQEGALGPSDVLLALAVLDERETAIHAGLCHRGDWRWLQ